jgi:hypothetical protein
MSERVDEPGVAHSVPGRIAGSPVARIAGCRIAG